jgi:hypothetical protein
MEVAVAAMKVVQGMAMTAANGSDINGGDDNGGSGRDGGMHWRWQHVLEASECIGRAWRRIELMEP